MDTPPSTVGPGIGAFIAFFVLALCLWLLMRNMNGRMRRMAYREQQRVADLEAAEAQKSASAAPGTPGTGTKRRKRSAEKPVPQAEHPRTKAPRTEPPQAEPDEPTP
jgi:predicted lipid-binding transport protein (Tim44 family)